MKLNRYDNQPPKVLKFETFRSKTSARRKELDTYFTEDKNVADKMFKGTAHLWVVND